MLVRRIHTGCETAVHSGTCALCRHLVKSAGTLEGQAFSSLPAEDSTPAEVSCNSEILSTPSSAFPSPHAVHGDHGSTGRLSSSGSISRPVLNADARPPSSQSSFDPTPESGGRALRASWPPLPAKGLPALAHRHSQQYKPPLHLTPPQKPQQGPVAASSLPLLPSLEHVHAYVAGKGSSLTPTQVAESCWLAAKFASKGRWHRDLERPQQIPAAGSSSSSFSRTSLGWGSKSVHHHEQQQAQQHQHQRTKPRSSKRGSATKPARFPILNPQPHQQQQHHEGPGALALRIQTLLDPLVAHHLSSMSAKALSQVLWSWPKTGHKPLWSLTEALMQKLQLRVAQEASELLPGALPPQLLALTASGTAQAHPERLVWEVQQHQKQQQQEQQQQENLVTLGSPSSKQQQQAVPGEAPSSSSSSGGSVAGSSSGGRERGTSMVAQAQALAQLGYTLGTVYYALGRLRETSNKWARYAETQAELLAPVTAVVFGELTQIPQEVLETRIAHAAAAGDVRGEGGVAGLQSTATSSSSKGGGPSTGDSEPISSTGSRQSSMRQARLVESLCVLLYSSTRLGLESPLLKEQLLIPLLQHLLPRVPSLTPDQLALVLSSLACLCRDSLPVHQQRPSGTAAGGGQLRGSLRTGVKPGRNKDNFKFVRHMIEETEVWDTSGWGEQEIYRQWQEALEPAQGGGVPGALNTSSRSNEGSSGWGMPSNTNSSSSSSSSRRWGAPSTDSSSSSGSRGGRRSRLELFQGIAPPSVPASHAMAILDVFQSCCRQMLVAAPAAKRQELVTYAWCLATCCGPTSRLSFIPPYLGLVLQPLEAIASMLTESGGINELQPDQIARLVWAYGKLMYNHDQFLDALAAAAVLKARHMCPQDLANTAWGFASVNHSCPELVRVLSQEGVKKMAGFKPLELCNMLWSFAVLDHWDQEFSAAAEEVIAGWDLMDLHWSLQKQLLQVHHAHLFKWTTSNPSPEALAAAVGGVEAAGAAAVGNGGKAAQKRASSSPSTAVAGAVGREGVGSSIRSSWNTTPTAAGSSSSSRDSSTGMRSEEEGDSMWERGPLFTLPEDQLPQLRNNVWGQQDLFRESFFQQEVFDTLRKKLKLVTDLEVLIEDLDTKIDAVVYYKGLQVCLETDGPHHYTLRHPRVRAGRSVLRDRMMAMAGLLTAVVPVHEWRALRHSEKAGYLRGVLEEAKQRHQQRKAVLEAAAAAPVAATGGDAVEAAVLDVRNAAAAAAAAGEGGEGQSAVAAAGEVGEGMGLEEQAGLDQSSSSSTSTAKEWRQHCTTGPRFP